MCSLLAEHTLLPVDRVSFALVNWRHNFLVSASLLWAPTAVHSTPSKHRPKRMLPKQVDCTKWSQLHLFCVYQTCSCSQWKNWRSRDCSYSWEKGTISLEDRGPPSFPPSSPGTSPAPHQLLWLSVCALVSFPSNSPSFWSSSPALPSLWHSHQIVSWAPLAIINTLASNRHKCLAISQLGRPCHTKTLSDVFIMEVHHHWEYWSSWTGR